MVGFHMLQVRQGNEIQFEVQMSNSHLVPFGPVFMSVSIIIESYSNLQYSGIVY